MVHPQVGRSRFEGGRLGREREWNHDFSVVTTPCARGQSFPGFRENISLLPVTRETAVHNYKTWWWGRLPRQSFRQKRRLKLSEHKRTATRRQLYILPSPRDSILLSCTRRVLYGQQYYYPLIFTSHVSTANVNNNNRVRRLAAVVDEFVCGVGASAHSSLV